MDPIVIPELSVVVLIGASGSSKSTFARRHFLPTEVISSDFCRGVVSDDENSQEASKDAFDLLHFVMEKRLASGRMVVVDATNVQETSRRSLVNIARKYHSVPVAIVLDVPSQVCIDRNESRPDRQFGKHVVLNHSRDLRRSIPGLAKERFRNVYVLRSVEDIENATVVRQPLWTNRKNEVGPFDIIGDIHGCFDELVELLTKLGYQVKTHEDGTSNVTPPAGRKAIFLGDLVDRGPKSPQVLKLVMRMVAENEAFCVPGNHDEKLHKKLRGKNVQVRHGLETTLEQLALEPVEFLEELETFLDGLVSHYVLDGGRLVVAHGGMKEEYQGRASAAVREFALYGDATGEMDEFGLPVRNNWAATYRGNAKVIYGHTPVAEPEWLNGALNIDTGCVFGGKLTALRYPELQLMSVPSHREYAKSRKPFLEVGASNLSPQQRADELLDLKDVIGKRLIQTGLKGAITIQEENSSAALEVMSRFAVDPKWLAYLPPTMAPTETSQQPDLLEHLSEGLDYFRNESCTTVICEEKHMGSRAIVVLCRDAESARRRFGTGGEAIGSIYTRTGRSFFSHETLETAFLERLRLAADSAQLWKNLRTTWVILDCELMPWSAKAQELLRQQYASVGAAAIASSRLALATVQSAVDRGVEGADFLLSRLVEREVTSRQFVDAYRRYCWKVDSLDDYRLAPFHILASEGHVHTDKDHVWHMQTIAELCEGEPLLFKTPYLTVNLFDSDSCQKAIDWWTDLTDRGGEGVVIKPLEFVVQGPHGLVQPAVKCRGKEYLRIIYGPEYTLPKYLARLKKRAVSHKRSLALREFALGIEGLQRFVSHQPLRKVHECVFGVLALESEPVDPRL